MMVRGGIFSAALALVLMCLALVNNVDAARAHELFDQSTYYEQPTTVLGVDPVKNVDDNLPEKTTTSITSAAQSSTNSQPQEAVVSTDNGSPQNPQSATVAEATPPLGAIPKEPQQQQQHYRDYRGTTSVQGDFMPGARPWWSNPQYGNSGNYFQDRNPEVDIPNIPNRYPTGYPTHYTGPQYYYQQNSNPANAQYSAIHTRQYSSTPQQQQQQYFPTVFPQYNGNLPFEKIAGGCPTQYWVSNTQRWPAFFNVKTTVGEALGSPASKVFGETTVLQALLNTRPDGYSTLLRSAATAILNSYSRSEYKYSHVSVIELFAAALSSSRAAAEQAASFEEANVSAYREQYNSCA